MDRNVFRLDEPTPEETTVENGFNHVAPRDQAYTEPIHGEVTIDITSRLEELIGYAGRMLSASKSGYTAQYPDHTVLFNACVFTEDSTQVWFGDLDLSLEAAKLQQAATTLALVLIVTPEQPFRWHGLAAGQDDTWARDRIVRFSPQFESDQD